MKKYYKICLALLGFTLLGAGCLWYINASVSQGVSVQFNLFVSRMVILGFETGIALISLFISCLYTKIKKTDKFPLLLFGIINAILLIGFFVTGYIVAITDTSMFFTGLAGVLLILFGCPIPLLLLIISIVAGLIRKRRQKQSS